MARKLDEAAIMNKLERRLSRQQSVQIQEVEQCHLAPTLEGRIFRLDDQVKPACERISHTEGDFKGLWNKMGFIFGFSLVSLGLVWFIKKKLNK